MNIVPIGFLESCYRDKFATPRQPGLAPGAWARIVINPEWQPELALQGLEGYSHLWIIWIFHKNSSARYHAKVHPPRLGGESRGVFATRTPHRPNPIGLSLVEIVKIENGHIIVAGADIVDGTPILDIKPYLPEVESKPQARAGWSGEIRDQQIRVEFSEDANLSLEKWQKFHLDKDLKNIIVETLVLDPRPVVYRGFEGQEQGPYRSEHAFRLFDGDIHFKFVSAEQIIVFNILFEHN